MPIILFQIALIIIIIHAGYVAFKSIESKDWVTFAYQIAVGFAAIWFFLYNT
ncbi:hypothetical protein IC620_04185 [Hazenella sp. IB182357]|uniref:Uncharacterized protein n=1 Tax=Polycladospora coralii TaxID=2771432 RepID=A0A926N591_9BACL|nr:hypothetical protein [Polycladospora coralii]MBD1371554.1 hypothetical protein [Polycladospora coralii]MBS7529022.1 hypothetical protein [Polycladospora coralii]